MRTTLIYNSHAGGAASLSSDDLQAAMLDIGLSPIYRSTSSENDLGAALEDPGDLVVVAGGDGTVRAVATRLVGRGVPLAILPMGTANNIGASLGLSGGPLEILAGLGRPRMVPFDLGHVRGPWGEDYFLEAAGFGLFAAVMSAYDPEAGKSPLRAIQSLVSTLASYQAGRWQVTLDGEDISGQYLLVEAMNTTATGPRLRLAPNADPADGWLEVVLIAEDHRVGLAAYLGGLITGTLEALPNVTVRRGRHLRLEWDGTPVHLDAEVRPQPRRQSADTEPAEGATPDHRDPEKPASLVAGPVEIELLPGAIELLLPGLPDGAPAGLPASSVLTAGPGAGTREVKA